MACEPDVALLMTTSGSLDTFLTLWRPAGFGNFQKKNA